jgi:CHAT domain-containing protein
MDLTASERAPTTPDPVEQTSCIEADHIAALTRQHSARLGPGAAGETAWELKASFDAYESSAPDRAIEAAAALQELAEATGDPTCVAVAAWTRGMADQIQGDLPASLVYLEQAETAFAALGLPLVAAETLISKLFSLAMLGRYEEALQVGMRARAIFLGQGDILAAGKVEQNLGNIYFRRDEYRKAEQLYRTARKRFVVVGDPKQLAQIDNCLASALTWQQKFRAALAHYDQALARATEAGLQVTQAEIESNLGGLMLFQARYDRALDYLERARRRYTAMGLEHEAAISEKELAEAYLELNLIPEALALLQRLLPTFEELGMQADLAGTFTSFARACIGSQRLAEAQTALATAHLLYEQEENALGIAYTELVEVQRRLAVGEYSAAVKLAHTAEHALAEGKATEWLLRLHTLRAAAHRHLGEDGASDELLTATLAEAQEHGYPQIELRCLVALGTPALAGGREREARQLLGAALATFETLRATLPSEEFRLSFRSDQASLFDGLITLALAAGQTEEALQLVERARSYTLLELANGAIPVALQPRDDFEAALLEKLSEQRSELNWFYHQLNPIHMGDAPLSAATLAQLRQGANQRELEIATLMRQLRQRSGEGAHGGQAPTPGTGLALDALQRQLAGDTVLVEYFGLGDRLLAFVVTGSAVEIVTIELPLSQVEQTVHQLRFQIDTLRHGGAHLARHLPRLTERCNYYLRQLHAALIEPILPHVQGRRLAIVPFGALHYVPFQALHSGRSHLIEEVEVCIAPSAGVLLFCLEQARSKPQRFVLIGAPDERTPLLVREIVALHELIPTAEVRIGEDATVGAVRSLAPEADVLHLACHGQFRPDNPMFSALHLADGWLTARDAYDLRLRCSLVTLSACETGINAVTPGDELLGLVRGFLAAGAPALLVSLWPVDDATTVQFMRHFYAAWLSGATLAAAHRAAQCALLAQSPHPFFWSPFVLFGRWY